MSKHKMTNPNAALYTHNGISDTLGGWAKRLGIGVTTFWYRIQKGYPPELLFAPGKVRAILPKKTQGKRFLTFDGETHSVAEWARRKGIHVRALYSRLYDGWTVEQALTCDSLKREAPPEGYKICPHCNRPLLKECFKSYREICKDCGQHRNHLVRIELRNKLIEFYTDGAMKCDLCPESRIEVLDIDHRDGGGAVARRSDPQSYAYYRRILAEADKSKYRVLCRNCNWIEHLRLNGLGQYRTIRQDS